MTPVILLAAGDWRRLEKPVPLLPWGSATIIEHVLDTLSHTTASPTIVVLGHEAWSIRKKIEGRPVRIVVDEGHRSGISSWIRCGLSAVPEDAEGVIVAFCEQPAVPASVFDALIEAQRGSGKGIVVPVYRERRGRPLLFGLGRYRERLLALGEGANLDDVMGSNPEDVIEVPVATSAVVTDVSAERGPA